MKRYRICVLIIVLFVFPSLCYAQGAKEAVLGTWKLISIETVRANGEALYDRMGRNPVGLIIYDSMGYMSVQFMRDPRPKFASGDHWKATPEETNAAYAGYYACFGTYEVNEKEGFVLLHVQGSLWPEEVGMDYKRSFKISGNRLILTSPPYQRAGEQFFNRITYERIEKSK